MAHRCKSAVLPMAKPYTSHHEVDGWRRCNWSKPVRADLRIFLISRTALHTEPFNTPNRSLRERVVKPVVVLIGRPNVGKSTLFNRLTRSRAALVADMPGRTRDRQYGDGRVGDRPYFVVDTGGVVDT